MTFLESVRLFLLVLPVGLAVIYVFLQCRRRAVAVRFTSVELLASIAPRRSGWQRHVAPFGLLLTLVVLTMAFAQPARSIRTPRQRATVILTVDVSGSMTATDVKPTRLLAAQQAAKVFAQALPAGVQLGLVSFSTDAQVLVAPTTDRTTITSAIDSLQAGGATNTGTAIDLALKAIAGVPNGVNGAKAPAAIVLMSDGAPTLGNGTSPLQSAVDAAAAARQAGVPVNTIAFGTADGVIAVRGQDVPVPWDPATMATIASQSGGHTFTAQTAGQLKSVYSDIGRTVGYDVHLKDITALFVGIALASATLAAAAALYWSQRIA